MVNRVRRILYGTRFILNKTWCGLGRRERILNKTWSELATLRQIMNKICRAQYIPRLIQDALFRAPLKAQLITIGIAHVQLLCAPWSNLRFLNVDAV